jgi:GH24 family phage-related lysozyme (muramidase)
MSFLPEVKNSGVRQDFPLRHDVDMNRLNLRSGFLKPTDPILTHPEANGVGLGNANVSTNTPDMLRGYFYSSATLTANRNLTLPDAVDIVACLVTVLKTSTSKIAGSWFVFSLDNTQAGAFTRTLVAGAGDTLQGTGFDVSQNEVAMFLVYVESATAVNISRYNIGPSVIPTLSEVLNAGNTSGAFNIVFSPVTRGIVSGPTNNPVAANAVTVNGTAGTITDSGVVATGARTDIVVTNSAVAANSQVFIQVGRDATAGQNASLLASAFVTGAGSFTISVFNTAGVSTTAAPVYYYWVVNPVL